MVNMLFLLFVLLVLALSVVLIIAITAALRPRTVASDHTNTDPEVLAVLTSAQRRAWGSIGVAVALLLIMLVIGSSLPSTLGLPLALAPMIAATGAILLQTIPGQRSFQASKSAVRSASLEARSPWAFVSKPALWAPILGAIALAGFLIFTGLTASADDFGLARALHIETENMGTGGGPYPGWYYGVPLLIAAAVLLGTTLLAHIRLSKIAAFPRADLGEIDATWRSGLARTVSAISVTGLLLTLGGVALFASRVILSIQGSLRGHGEPAPGWLSSGPFITVAGVLCILGAVTSIFLAARWAAILKQQALAITPLHPAQQPPMTNPYV